MKTLKHIILASKSPRRNEILKQAKVDFEIIPSLFDEKSLPISKPKEYAKIQSYKKCLCIAEKNSGSFVIGADTIVVAGTKILGKPKDKKDACNMLKELSGRSHLVITGYSIINIKEKKKVTKAVSTKVFFKKLSEAEIDWYVETKEPFGKAGAYAIQGIASIFVKKIEGSYSNVVGLPICEVIETLLKFKAVGF